MQKLGITTQSTRSLQPESNSQISDDITKIIRYPIYRLVTNYDNKPGGLILY